LERLSAAAPAHVVRFLEAGYSEVDECHYELIEYAPEGTLGDLMRNEGPRVPSEVVREVLSELVSALCHIHEHGIEHRDLKPANVLLRCREPLDLVLTDFGISSAVDATHRFTSTNRTVWYSPPEAMTGTIYRTKWDYWSLGIILVEMLSGSHPFDGLSEQAASYRLISQALDDLSQGVADPQWQQLCRGLLRRTPDLRWDGERIQRWLANPADPSLVVASDADGSVAPAPAFRFLGQPCRTPRELASALASDWEEAINLLDQDGAGVVRWVRHDVGETAAADGLARLLRARGGSHPEATLVGALQLLSPGTEPAFRGTPLNPTTVGQFARRAIAGDSGAGAWLTGLYESGALVLLRDVPTADERIRSLGARWDRSLKEYRELRKRAAPTADDVPLGMILGATIPFEGPLDDLREYAELAATRLARRRPWYRALGEPAKVDGVRAVLLAQLGPVAEAEVHAARRASADERGRLWSDVAAGAAASGVLTAVWWMAVSEWCRSVDPLCNAWRNTGIGGVGTFVVIAVGVFTVGALIRLNRIASED